MYTSLVLAVLSLGPFYPVIRCPPPPPATYSLEPGESAYYEAESAERLRDGWLVRRRRAVRTWDEGCVLIGRAEDGRYYICVNGMREHAELSKYWPPR
jgi:hypothetical protein